MLSRPAIDYARIVQLVLALIASLVPWLAELEDEANVVVVAVTGLVVMYLEKRKRDSATPLDSPTAADGTPLVKVAKRVGYQEWAR